MAPQEDLKNAKLLIAKRLNATSKDDLEVGSVGSVGYVGYVGSVGSIGTSLDTFGRSSTSGLPMPVQSSRRFAGGLGGLRQRLSYDQIR